MKPYKYIPITLSLALILLFASCANENMTTITLNIDVSHIAFNNDKKQLHLIDRFLAFFSGRAYAFTTSSWLTATTTLTLTVSAIDMETITVNIPFVYSSGAKVSHTVQIPSGPKRKFIITTINGSSQKNWGGQKVLDLAPGDAVELPIMMIPMPILYSGWPDGNNLHWYNFTSFPSYINIVQEFRIYYSSTINGEYSFVGKSTGYTSDSYNFASVPVGYYKASVYGIYGESPLSDAIVK